MILIDFARNTRYVGLRGFLFAIRATFSIQRLMELQMFQAPSMVTLSIAATRIYRSLTEHVDGRTELCDITLSHSSQS